MVSSAQRFIRERPCPSVAGTTISSGGEGNVATVSCPSMGNGRTVPGKIKPVGSQ